MSESLLLIIIIIIIVIAVIIVRSSSVIVNGIFDIIMIIVSLSFVAKNKPTNYSVATVFHFISCMLSFWKSS